MAYKASKQIPKNLMWKTNSLSRTDNLRFKEPRDPENSDDKRKIRQQEWLWARDDF
jgi:hypothetical protein